MKVNIFDIDNTLLYTDELNNMSYQFACSQLGYMLESCGERITRNSIQDHFPEITDNDMKQIISIKQQYFSQHLDRLHINHKLVNVLSNCDHEKCIVWTGAEPERVESMLQFYKWNKYFSEIRYLDKTDIQAINNSLCQICQRYKCSLECLAIYEDNPKVISFLQQLGCAVNPEGL